MSSALNESSANRASNVAMHSKHAMEYVCCKINKKTLPFGMQGPSLPVKRRRVYSTSYWSKDMFDVMRLNRGQWKADRHKIHVQSTCIDILSQRSFYLFWKVFVHDPLPGLVLERYIWLVSPSLPLPLPQLKGRREEVGREKGRRMRRVDMRLISPNGITGKGNSIVRLVSHLMIIVVLQTYPWVLYQRVFVFTMNCTHLAPSPCVRKSVHVE